jgi:hypothetical protein
MWFKNFFDAKKVHLNPELSGVTVILTVWKRNHLLEQLNSLLNQQQLPYQIWVYQCGNHIDLSKIKKKFPYIEFIQSTFNLKYFGRFSLAQFVRSKFTWILDDDVIPSDNWLEKARKKCELENAIVSCTGRIIPEGDYFPERFQNIDRYFIGDIEPSVLYNSCPTDTVVDFGCNSWLFKSEWIKAFWQIPPYSLATGEDIHLSASCKIKLGVSTIVPYQIDRTSGNLKKWYGHDNFASWKKSDFQESRASIIRYFVEQHGWKPLNWIK